VGKTVTYYSGEMDGLVRFSGKTESGDSKWSLLKKKVGGGDSLGMLGFRSRAHFEFKEEPKGVQGSVPGQVSFYGRGFWEAYSQVGSLAGGQ